jgi:iduronate 2-sulfatase
MCRSVKRRPSLNHAQYESELNMSIQRQSYDWIVRLAIVALAILCTGIPGPAGAAQLNVLFIAVDDLRPELGVYGVDEIITPNIDALAQQGTTFTRAYAQMALCTPSRSSLLTGLRPDATGVKDNSTYFRDTVPNVVTLPQWFKQNGYQTQAVCKVFHDGLDDSQSWTLPPKNGAGPPIPVGPDGKRVAFAAVDKPEQNFGDYRCADQAIQSINELRDLPFFVAVGFRKPHLPFLAPPAYFDKYDRYAIPEATNLSRALNAPHFQFYDSPALRSSYSQIPASGPFDEELRRNLKRGYYAATSFVDTQVGRVLAALDEAGLSQNTLVIFWGDHGFHLGEQGEWNKSTNFEVATRVPLIFKGPDVPIGATSSALVELVDLYPTVAQLAGLSIPSTALHGGLSLQGDSIVTLIQNPSMQSTRGAFYQGSSNGYEGRSLRTDRYRFTEWTNQSTKRYELYNHEGDPSETINVASDPSYASVLPVLKAALAAGGQGDLPAQLLDPNRAPSISITSPLQGSDHVPGRVIPLTVNTSDTDGDAVTVSWTANGDPISEPWTPVEGNYTVVAIAHDGNGNSTNDSVSITVTDHGGSSGGSNGGGGGGGGGRGGCAYAPGQPFDPTLPALLAFALVALVVRRMGAK